MDHQSRSSLQRLRLQVPDELLLLLPKLFNLCLKVFLLRFRHSFHVQCILIHCINLSAVLCKFRTGRLQISVGLLCRRSDSTCTVDHVVQFGSQFLDAMILCLNMKLVGLLLAHRLCSLFIQQKVLLGNFIGCLLFNACKLISSFTHKRISLTFHDLSVTSIRLTLQCLLLSSHQLTCQCGINTLLYHCNLCGTLINVVEVDGVELTNVNV